MQGEWEFARRKQSGKRNAESTCNGENRRHGGVRRNGGNLWLLSAGGVPGTRKVSSPAPTEQGEEEYRSPSQRQVDHLHENGILPRSPRALG